MANDAIPFYEDGDELTGTATSAITGMTLVKISGDRQADGTLSLAPAGAGDLAFGVAMYDAASGKRVTVHTIESGHVMPISNTAAVIAANTPVKVAAGGQVVAAAGGDKCIGFTVTGASASTQAQVLLSRFTA